MYCLQIKDKDYQRFAFKFNSMEELSVFASTVFATSKNENIEVIITKEVIVDAETL